MHALGGTLVAYAGVTVEGPTSQDGFGAVHPAHVGRGIGTFLLSEIERRARERAAPGSVLRFVAAAEDDAAHGLARSLGLAPVRRYAHMERELDDLPAATVPEGVEIRRYALGAEDRALFDTKEAAFAGHFAVEPDTFERWKARVETLETFSPEGVFLAWHGEESVGMVEAFAAGGVGWIGELGVRPEWRGRGIGAALLVRGFEHLGSLGLRSVRLNVDLENETGAVRLYERHGMRIRREWRVSDKTLGR